MGRVYGFFCAVVVAAVIVVYFRLCRREEQRDHQTQKKHTEYSEPSSRSQMEIIRSLSRVFGFSVFSVIRIQNKNKIELEEEIDKEKGRYGEYKRKENKNKRICSIIPTFG